jgi:Arylsulfotransferase (ASST)
MARNEGSTSSSRRAGSRALPLALVAVGLAAAYLYGAFSAQKQLPPFTTVRAAYQFMKSKSPQREEQSGTWGLWRPRTSGHEAQDDADRQKIAELEAIGYVAGTEHEVVTDVVPVYDSDRAYNGYNLYLSGNAPIAYLLDMHGKVLHEWTYPFEKAWPGRKLGDPTADYLRRAHLFENGDLIAIHGGDGMLKLDKSSNLIWATEVGCHHDFEVQPDGTIYALTREVKILPRFNEKEPVIEDFVSILDSNGKLLRKVSIIETIERSVFVPIIHHRLNVRKVGDILHPNSVEVLDGSLEHKIPAFRKGNVLVSLLVLNAIAVIDMDTEEVVWLTSGMFQKQHDPTMLANGHMMVFDNLGNGGYSRVVEFDPSTLEVAWIFGGKPPPDFFTAAVGGNHRLPNGNTLAIESENGCVYEATPDCTIVWQFVNPKRAGDHDELIACIFDMTRIPPDFPVDWLAGSAGAGAVGASSASVAPPTP